MDSKYDQSLVDVIITYSVDILEGGGLESQFKDAVSKCLLGALEGFPFRESQVDTTEPNLHKLPDWTSLSQIQGQK